MAVAFLATPPWAPPPSPSGTWRASSSRASSRASWASRAPPSGRRARGRAVGVGAGAGAGFFAGVAFFAGVFAFAGDLAPPEPRNLSLKSLFDRFFSCALNASSARIFAQAPAETNERGGNVSERFRNVSSRFAKKKRRDGPRSRSNLARTSRAPNVDKSAVGCSRIVAPRRLVGEGRTGTVLATPAASAADRRSPLGGRLAGRRRGLGLLVVGLGLLRENSGGERNEVRQPGEATRGGRASNCATSAARVLTAARARGSDGRGATRADRVSRRTRRPAPPRIREARLRNQKSSSETKLKRAFERGSVASRARTGAALALALDLLFFFAIVRSAPVWSGASVLWREPTRARRVHRGSPRPNRGFATERILGGKNDCDLRETDVDRSTDAS